jgi:hypothetical protein
MWTYVIDVLTRDVFHCVLWAVIGEGQCYGRLLCLHGMLSYLLFPGLTILFSVIFRLAVVVGFVVNEGGLPLYYQ